MVRATATSAPTWFRHWWSTASSSQAHLLHAWGTFPTLSSLPCAHLAVVCRPCCGECTARCVAYTCSGEWPLFFAACTNQATMVDVLVAAGADLDAHDCNGNTILHLLVYHELPEMYDHVVDLWKHQRGIRGAEEETTRAWHPCPPQAQAHAHGQTVTWCHLLLLCCHALSCAVTCCRVFSRCTAEGSIRAHTQLLCPSQLPLNTTTTTTTM